jgi:hypothetical protein
MADAVTTRTLLDDKQQTIVHLTNISDGTGEAAVVKIDKAAVIAAMDGSAADALEIVFVRWCIQGFSSVRILTDHTADDVQLVLSGNGFEDFNEGGLVVNQGSTEGLKDPRSAGGTGNILLTTAGAVSGATYDITLGVRKATT